MARKYDIAKAVEFYRGYTLKELRRLQSLCEQQIARAHQLRKTEVLERLQATEWALIETIAQGNY
jgi:hypothetical protein